MRKHLIVAGIAAATLIPTFAFAQQTCEDRRNNRVAGTVVGGVLGALAGSAVAGHGDRNEGAVIGGIGGAVIGNQVTKGSGDCQHAYGYYDTNGMWHSNAVSRQSASGYYNRDGAWVEGAPNGYYDGQNRWIAANSASSAAGYYDNGGRWVPASASGYYDTDGRWVAGAASGYYDNGRWIAGPTTGRYDSNGRWMTGQADGHRDANGRWVADAQTGYYDGNGRWRAGPVMGYYDGNGRWIATSASAGAYGQQPSYGQQANYEGRSNWRDAPRDVHERTAWLEQRIQRGRDDGTLSRREAYDAMRSLNSIRQQDRSMRRHGQLRDRDEAIIQARLDDLNSRIRWARQN